MKNVWIFAEQRDGVVNSAYYEMLSETRKLYGDNAVVSAVVFGCGDLPVDELKASGADKVYALDSEKLREYEPMVYTEAFTKLIRDEKPDVVFVLRQDAVDACMFNCPGEKPEMYPLDYDFP